MQEKGTRPIQAKRKWKSIAFINKNKVMKSFTDIEQSKKLTEILPIESADMHYVRKTHDFMGNPVDGEWSHPKYGNPNSKHANYIIQNFETLEKIPCWSLAALLSVIPSGKALIHDKGNRGYKCICNNIDTYFYDNPIDACYEMILKLKENNLL